MQIASSWRFMVKDFESKKGACLLSHHRCVVRNISLIATTHGTRCHTIIQTIGNAGGDPPLSLRSRGGLLLAFSEDPLFVTNSLDMAQISPQLRSYAQVPPVERSRASVAISDRCCGREADFYIRPSFALEALFSPTSPLIRLGNRHRPFVHRL